MKANESCGNHLQQVREGSRDDATGRIVRFAELFNLDSTTFTDCGVGASSIFRLLES